MDLLHVTTELSPYIKVGGLADVVAALSKNLKLLGHRVTVVIPRYAALSNALMMARRLTPLRFTHAGQPFEVAVYDARLPSGVELVALEIPGMFDREGIYGFDGQDYPDNAIRFATFSKAVAEFIASRENAVGRFDLVHAHDWMTSLVHYFCREMGENKPASVLTIHNLVHQGITARDDLPKLGLSWNDFNIDGAEFYGRVNILKLGINCVDAITTVSETYAREIVTAHHGAGLEGLLLHRKDALTGITNGVDASVWNPATDVALPARYDVEDPTNKSRCKGALLAELELDIEMTRPLFGFVGRLVAQKGADILVGALPRILAEDATVVVAGDGDPALIRKLEQAVEKHKGRVAFVHAASEGFVHRLFAGADFVVVPSRFEPCGLVQLYGQRYGAVPIAHSVGGLCDTIVDCDAELETGTGFLFDEATPVALLGAIQRATAAYRSKRFLSLTRRVMRLDRGWERPARRYEQIYRNLIS